MERQDTTIPLTPRETIWIREILGTRPEWQDVDAGKIRVRNRAYRDGGLSVQLNTTEPHIRELGWAGFIGRVVIVTADGSLIEVRLDHVNGRLQELFVLFVDPKHPDRTLPDEWIENSHEVHAL